MALNFFRTPVPGIPVERLKSMLDHGEEFVLIDVREPNERNIASIGGTNVPLQKLPDTIEDVVEDKETRIVVYCRSGSRSARAVEYMRAMGYRNVVNLEGGILAWIERIDPTLTPY
ncbi:rhodanese-like domain-containing protein [Rhodocaloribacter litoris]|uniref:rhodanese-like domain-containing protein n=1 Tax=Rhodocaloribacter litoris TaxID=2558931 RepID=UPI0014210561|nr:rhodanese-like domain-containing protein [Rhodocaloribacter litoris]QXD15354.1 rhodanese-like domain-containing protein [Rhodocaloribacter litoris]